MTFWFDRRPGQRVAVSNEDPDPRTDECAVLYGADGPPDWVKIPEGLPESGMRVRVTAHHHAPCPMCNSERSFLHLVLDSVDMCVCECLEGCGFVFYRTRKKDSNADSA